MNRTRSTTPEQRESRERKQRRRRERRLFLSLSSFFGLGLAIGLAGALYVAWMVYPLNPPVGSPAVFLDFYKKEYVYMVSQSYAHHGDWEIAKAQLDQLADPDIAQYVVAELDLYLRSGRSADAVRDMAGLAQALGAEGRALDVFAPTPIVDNEIEILPTFTPTLITPTSAVATPTLLPTPSLVLSPTPLPVEPTLTPLQPESFPFALISQTARCDLQNQPRIEITVQDGAGNGMPLEQIIVSWEEGEDRFITGFKSEINPGYADFTMDSEDDGENEGDALRSYSVSLVSGSEVVGGIQADRCEGGTGRTSWVLIFQER